jgi:hypothetical protein
LFRMIAVCLTFKSISFFMFEAIKKRIIFAKL